MPLKAYKLVRQRKDGTLGPLFIDATLRIPFDEWLVAGCHPRKGFAVRPGWHCTSKPYAPHLKEEGRVWVEVEITDYEEFNRPANQGGLWFIAKHMRVLRILDNEEISTINGGYNALHAHAQHDARVQA